MRSLNLMLSLISLINATSTPTDSTTIVKTAEEETPATQQKTSIDDLTNKLKKQEDSIKDLMQSIEKIESLVNGVSSNAPGFPFSFSILFIIGCVLSFLTSRYLYIKDR